MFLFFIFLPFKLCKIIFNCHAYQRETDRGAERSCLSHATDRGLPLIVSNLVASVSHLTPVPFSRRASNWLYSQSDSQSQCRIGHQKRAQSRRFASPPPLILTSCRTVKIFSLHSGCVLRPVLFLSPALSPSLLATLCVVLFLFSLRSMPCFVSKVQSASRISVWIHSTSGTRYVCCYCRSL